MARIVRIENIFPVVEKFTSYLATFVGRPERDGVDQKIILIEELFIEFYLLMKQIQIIIATPLISVQLGNQKMAIPKDAMSYYTSMSIVASNIKKR